MSSTTYTPICSNQSIRSATRSRYAVSYRPGSGSRASQKIRNRAWFHPQSRAIRSIVARSWCDIRSGVLLAEPSTFAPWRISARAWSSVIQG